MSVYLAVGHGRKPDGTYDPGAVNGSAKEHELAHVVVDAAAALLSRAGVAVTAEQDGGVGHDPNYKGSVQRVNAGNYAVAVEVHFDWRGAPRGGFGLYVSEAGSRLAGAVRNRWGQAGLPQRPNTKRTDLYFLRYSKPVALLWECDRVAAYDAATLTRMGEAIALGVCDFLGVSPKPKEQKPMYDPPIPVAAVWKDEAGRVLAGVAPDGGVFAWGVPYRGGPNRKPYWGNRRAAAIKANPQHAENPAVYPHYVVVATSGEEYGHTGFPDR